ncbi:MAG: SGNH/GDSL hydrolase family protein [Candidatus Sumerlaeota bacterium]|nr:SGNH/GDSL hydrolase family protein [Candidatus Sumerlaeota bacterium]
MSLVALISSSLSAAEYIQPRDGLRSSFRKFSDSQKSGVYTKIAFFGGSSAAGAGLVKPETSYRALLMKHLREQFPKAVLAENNASIAGTDSWLGAFRTKTDPLYGGAALVIVDFAVEDAGANESQVLAAMEGIVRQIWASDSSTDIVFVYSLAKDQWEAVAQGQTPPAVSWHEKIAEYYKIPSVNLARFAAEKIKSGEAKIDDCFTSVGLASSKLHGLYFEALKPLVAQCKAALEQDSAPIKRHAMPKPLSAAPMDKARCVPYDWAKMEDGWKMGRRSTSERFLHVLECDRSGAILSLKFKGAAAGFFGVAGPDSGDIESSVDGGEWKPCFKFSKEFAGGVRALGRPAAQGLDPNQPHEMRLRVAEKQPSESAGRSAHIGWLLVDGDAEDPFKGMTPLERIDAIYSRMDPLKYAPPTDRWKRLPKTMQRLREGPSLKIVMLGDSIIGDTSSSQYELLLGRLYPKCKIEKVLSVRGSTGCWWYKDENRVEEWVLRHKPDLLMIGGISQREDVDAIREVIHQVRAKQSPEILLMTPAFGAVSDAHIKKWTYDIDPGSSDYRARLKRLSDEEQCEFIDMTGTWWKYVQDSGKDYGWFKRDGVHANDRGFQILGRILEKYFTP